jgi:hypothetical protein
MAVDSVRQKAGIQRVRIGLTGLASVFLAVLLAAVFTGRTREEAPITANSTTPAGPGAATQPVPVTQSPSEEPLATLGLTPSNPESNGAAQPAPNAPPAGRR